MQGSPLYVPFVEMIDTPRVRLRLVPWGALPRAAGLAAVCAGAWDAAEALFTAGLALCDVRPISVCQGTTREVGR